MQILKPSLSLLLITVGMACAPGPSRPSFVSASGAARSRASTPDDEGLRLAATIQFGKIDVGSPYPPSADHDESSHAKDDIVPREVVIDRGGTVTFDVPAGTHQIAIYVPGTEPQDIDTTNVVRLCPGTAPRLINDATNRIALITHTCGTAWQAQYTFDSPGRYLVICAFLPHFQVGMYGWVNVRDR